MLLRKVEGLRGATPNSHRVLQKIGRYIHGDGARPSNVSCCGDMPRRISIVSRSYANIISSQLRIISFYIIVIIRKNKIYLKLLLIKNYFSFK